MKMLSRAAALVLVPGVTLAMEATGTEGVAEMQVSGKVLGIGVAVVVALGVVIWLAMRTSGAKK